MSDWMSGPHRTQRTVSVDAPVEPDPVELTDPVDVIAWLRAIPLWTVLIEDGDRPRAWQKRPWREATPCYRHESAVEIIAMVLAGSEEAYDLADDDDAAMVAENGPFHPVWMPGGAT